MSELSRARRARPASRSLRAALLAFVVTSSGCSFTNDLAPPSVVNACVSDAACGEASCVDGACVGASSAPLALAITIATDPSDSSAERFAYTVDGITVAAPAIHDIVVPALADVVGVVSLGALPVKADVRATRLGPYGVALGFDVASTRAAAATTAADGKPAHYALRVVATETYFVYAAPTGVVSDVYPGVPTLVAGTPLASVLPPLFVPTFRAVDQGGTTGFARVDFTYPTQLFSPCDAGTKSGCTISGRVALVDSVGTRTPPPSAQAYRVRASVRGTDLLVSNLATTEADGSFVLRITPGASAYDLVVEGAPNEGLPGTRLPIETLTFGASELVVELPKLSAVRYVATLETFEGEALAGASIELASSGLDAPATADEFHHETVSSADGSDGTTKGELDVVLLPGTYDVVIRPPTPEGGATLRTSIVIRAQADGRPIVGPLFVLPRASRLGGVVSTFDGGRAPYVMLAAAPIGTRALVGEAEPAFSLATTVADATGLFSLAIDRDVVDLFVSAGNASRFGSVVVPALDLSKGGDLADLEVRIPAPITLDGRVTIASSGSPLGGHVLRAYLALDGSAPRLVPIGVATTDAEGHYRFYLAPR